MERTSTLTRTMWTRRLYQLFGFVFIYSGRYCLVLDLGVNRKVIRREMEVNECGLGEDKSFEKEPENVRADIMGLMRFRGSTHTLRVLIVPLVTS